MLFNFFIWEMHYGLFVQQHNLVPTKHYHMNSNHVLRQHARQHTRKRAALPNHANDGNGATVQLDNHFDNGKP